MTYHCWQCQQLAPCCSHCNAWETIAHCFGISLEKEDRQKQTSCKKLTMAPCQSTWAPCPERNLPKELGLGTLCPFRADDLATLAFCIEICLPQKTFCGYPLNNATRTFEFCLHFQSFSSNLTYALKNRKPGLVCHDWGLFAPCHRDLWFGGGLQPLRNGRFRCKTSCAQLALAWCLRKGFFS